MIPLPDRYILAKQPRVIDTADEVALRDALTFVRDNPGVVDPPRPDQAVWDAHARRKTYERNHQPGFGVPDPVTPKGFASVDATGHLTTNHVTAGRDHNKVEWTLCGLQVPKDAEPCRIPWETSHCGTCRELDA